MSGLRGTIGSPKNDKVIAWIYDHIEPLDVKTRNRVLKMVQTMNLDRDHLLTIKDEGFRHRMAKLIKKDNDAETEKLTHRTASLKAIAYPLLSRLRNISNRNYRQAIKSEHETMDGME